MANEKNLITQRERTKNEQREIARKGGKKSGEKRRNKKTMREALEILMFDVEVDESAKDKLRKAGIDEKDFNNQMLITMGLMKKAREGDVQAYNAICAMIGEKPAERMELGGLMQSELRIKHITADPNDVKFPSSESEVDV